MSSMQPIVVKTAEGLEIWFYSWTEAAKYFKAATETMRGIYYSERYGKRNHFGILKIWLSNFDKEKLED